METATNTYTFTVADVEREVRLLANERPFFIYKPVAVIAATEDEEEGHYTGCSYVAGADGEGCIMGQALSRLGVPEYVLRGHEGMDVSAILRDLIAAPREETEYLRRVQLRQDEEMTWANAVQGAGKVAA